MLVLTPFRVLLTVLVAVDSAPPSSDPRRNDARADKHRSRHPPSGQLFHLDQDADDAAGNRAPRPPSAWGEACPTPP